MEELLGKKLRNEKGSLSIDQVQAVASLVKHIEVAQGKHKSYITIAMCRGDGMKILELFEEVWARQGKRQLDAPPPKPVMKELKDYERNRRQALQG